MAGLTSTGFEIKTIDECIAELEVDLRARLGQNLDTSPDELMGIIIGIVSEKLAQQWEAMRDVYASRTPGGAADQALTDLALITGTKRRDATYSTVTATVNLDAGFTLEIGKQASVDGDPSAVFETIEEVTNTDVSPNNVDVRMRATVTGPVRANLGTLTQIDTPTVGWNSVNNAADALLGEDVETDPALRVRRQEELIAQGSSNLDAIVSEVEDVEGVLQAVGFENDTDEPDGDLPAHSFEIVVWDGAGEDADDNALAQAIWDTKPAGILSYGTESGTAVDRQDNDRTVGFSRASSQDVYLEFDITTNDDFPVDGADQIAEAISDFGAENYEIGDDVILSALYGTVFTIAGVVSIDAVRAGFSSSPVGTSNLTIGVREIALLSASRVVVNT